MWILGLKGLSLARFLVLGWKISNSFLVEKWASILRTTYKSWSITFTSSSDQKKEAFLDFSKILKTPKYTHDVKATIHAVVQPPATKENIG